MKATYEKVRLAHAHCINAKRMFTDLHDREHVLLSGYWRFYGLKLITKKKGNSRTM